MTPQELCLPAASSRPPLRVHTMKDQARQRQYDQRSNRSEDCDVRHRYGQSDATHDSVPGYDRRIEALPNRQMKRGIMRNEIPHEHKGATNFDEWPKIKNEGGACTEQAKADDGTTRRS